MPDLLFIRHPFNSFWLQVWEKKKKEKRRIIRENLIELLYTSPSLALW